jgi:predicted acetyltransferase
VRRVSVEIRQLASDDLAAWYAAMNRAFFNASDPERMADARRSSLDYARALAAYDEGRVVATFRSFATEYTVPGGAMVPAAAVTNVTVSATHRRQGLLTAMMSRDLDAAKERGEPVAILIASEWPIYGRYGFGPATEHVTWEIDVPGARLRPEHQGEGTIAYSEPTEMRKLAPAVFDAHRAACPGELARSDFRWDIDFGVIPPAWPPDTGAGRTDHILCRDGDEVTGYATYQIKDDARDRVIDGVITLHELIAATPAAYARLWRFLTEHDLVTTIRAADRPVAEPLRWQVLDGRALRQAVRADFIWLRVLDVERALEARRYWTSGRVVLEVVDRLGYASGRFALDATPDGATCRRVDEEPDVTLDAAALGSVYLGGFGVRELALAGRVSEVRSGGIDTADAVLHAPVRPWSATWF